MEIVEFQEQSHKSASTVVSNPIRQSATKLWHAASTTVHLGQVVTVVVKQLNLTTRRIDLAFMHALNNSTLVGTAFAGYDEQALKKYTPGTRLEALVLAFDPIANVFCLTIEPKHIKTYKKNFEAKFREQVSLRPEQVIKAEVLFVASWFCVVGLRAHGLGCLAFMPLFRNDFTQLDAFKGECTGPEMAIKRQQLNRVSTAALGILEDRKLEASSKDDRHFAYYCVGQVGKVCVKFDGDGYTLVVHDLSTIKQNRKGLLRQLSILNETHVEAGDEGGVKRRADEEVVVVKKKVNLEAGSVGGRKRKLSEVNGEAGKDVIEVVADVRGGEAAAGGGGDVGGGFPWEVKDFEEFNKILNSLGSGENGEVDENVENRNPKKVKKAKKEFVDDKHLVEVSGKTFFNYFFNCFDFEYIEYLNIHIKASLFKNQNKTRKNQNTT